MTPQTEQRARRLLADYNSGLNLRQIALQEGVTYQRIDQLLRLLPEYVPRKGAPMVSLQCDVCKRPIRIDAFRVGKRKSGKFYCSRECYSIVRVKYHSKKEREEAKREYQNNRYRTNPEHRKRHQVSVKKWLAKKRKEDPAWALYYKKRMRIASNKWHKKKYNMLKLEREANKTKEEEQKKYSQSSG